MGWILDDHAAIYIDEGEYFEIEAGDNPVVRLTSTFQRPVKVWVRLRVDVEDLAVCRDDFVVEDMVGRPPACVGEVGDPSAKQKTGNSDRAFCGGFFSEH